MRKIERVCESMGKFNEDTRVKIPATIHLLRLGYEYQSLKDAKDLFDKKICCKLENQQLASLRDFLLPMLMNGQIIIK